jgi:hypothetical protein
MARKPFKQKTQAWLSKGAPREIQNKGSHHRQDGTMPLNRS